MREIARRVPLVCTCIPFSTAAVTLAFDKIHSLSLSVYPGVRKARKNKDVISGGHFFRFVAKKIKNALLQSSTKKKL
jgi:hypothetical protein